MDALDRMQAFEEALERNALRKILDALPDPEPRRPRSRDCAECGEPIPAARLAALPGARSCVECQCEIEAEEAGR
ncbi:MAG: TraR/DksA C4-type zinc finger protein [Rhodospirillaceae bacterium]|nr:TraR/DksA C4-type zinc finger protein [Rhodospirillaceae bacterium]